jgi:predicted nucleic acid-binding protein
LLENIGDERIVSRLALVELASVYSRAGLKSPLALALYSIDSVGAQLGELDFNEALLLAFRLSDTLKLRTLDLLHVISCKLLGAEQFATFDKRHYSQEGIDTETWNRGCNLVIFAESPVLMSAFCLHLASS